MGSGSTDLYWADATGVSYFTLPLGQGGVAVGGGHPIGVAADATNLYWTDAQAGTVSQVLLLGGQSPLVLASNQSNPAGIAVDSSNVYWTTLGSLDGGAVMATPIALASTAGPVQVLASGQATPYGIAVAGGSVFWQNLGTAPGHFQDGTVMMTLADGGGPAVALTSPQTSPLTRWQGPVDTLAVDSNDVYWIANGDVMWLQLADGGISSFGVGDAGDPQGIAIDSAHLYVTLGPDVLSVGLPPGSSRPVTLATGQSSPGPIAASSLGVYWGSSRSTGTCSILWLPVP